MSRSVLFLCTGNYYRSRFAEELFNERRQSGELRKKIREKSQSLLDVLAREARV